MSSIREGIRQLHAGDWHAAHEIAQEDSSALGSWLHGIVHLVEGDLGNANYWYSRANRPFPSSDAIAAELAELETEIASES